MNLALAKQAKHQGFHLDKHTNSYSLVDPFEKMKWNVHQPLLQEKKQKQKIQERKNNKKKKRERFGVHNRAFQPKNSNTITRSSTQGEEP